MSDVVYIEKTDIGATLSCWIYCGLWQLFAAEKLGLRGYINWPKERALVHYHDDKKFEEIPNMWDWYFEQPIFNTALKDVARIFEKLVHDAAALACLLVLDLDLKIIGPVVRHPWWPPQVQEEILHGGKDLAVFWVLLRECDSGARPERLGLTRKIPLDVLYEPLVKFPGQPSGLLAILKTLKHGGTKAAVADIFPNELTH